MEGKGHVVYPKMDVAGKAGLALINCQEVSMSMFDGVNHWQCDMHRIGTT